MLFPCRKSKIKQDYFPSPSGGGEIGSGLSGLCMANGMMMRAYTLHVLPNEG